MEPEIRTVPKDYREGPLAPAIPLLAEMFDLLKPVMKGREISGIIALGVETRIPALSVQHAQNAWNALDEKPSVPLLLLPQAGGTGTLPEAEIERFADRLDNSGSRRALLMVGNVVTGETVAALAPVLIRKGIRFDVVALEGSQFDVRKRAVGHFASDSQKQDLLAEIRRAERLSALGEQLLDFIDDCEAGYCQEPRIREMERIACGEESGDIDAQDGSPRARDRRILRLVRLADGIRRGGPGTAQRLSKWIEDHDIPEAGFDESFAGYVSSARSDPLSSVARRFGRKHAESDIANAVDGAGWPKDARFYAGEAWTFEPFADLAESLPQIIEACERDPYDPLGTLCGPSPRGVTQDLAEFSRDEARALIYRGTTVPKLLKGIETILQSIRDMVAGDRYGLIVGDDTSGRIPALLVAKSVNRYRKNRGLPPLPVLFVEGTRTLGSRLQQKQFDERFARKTGIDTSKRALVVTESVGFGRSVASIVERLGDHGIAADIATYGGASAAGLREIQQRDTIWKPGTRALTGRGDADLLIDREDLTGLRQGRQKFSPDMVIRGNDRISASVRETRLDISDAAGPLARALE